MLVFVNIGYAVKETHLDSSRVPGGCGACHRGHGERATMMLVQQKEELCFSCHGLPKKGFADGNGMDVYSVILKNSRHPVVETSHLHVPGEQIPESSVGARRHVSCFDCHNVHKSEKGNAIKGVRGYSGRGSRVKQLRKEFELCYSCHGDGGNAGNETIDVSIDFSPSNPSFHPVESFGRNHVIPSLRKGYLSSSLITCSDCHGNDDPSGPKGPHGSIYEPILKYRYIRTQGPESSSAYELCYSCHDRTNILNDMSFKAHKVHVVYNQISCAQCHDSHGSRINTSLITFDESAVFPNSSGEMTYMPMVQGRPRCYLSCHINGRENEHKLSQSLSYCVNGRCLQQW